MSQRAWIGIAVALSIAAWGCDDGQEASQPPSTAPKDMSASPDMRLVVDMMPDLSRAPDAKPDHMDMEEMSPNADLGQDMMSSPLSARTYCAATRELFCDYYMRCGRINATDKQECLALFDETCHAVYQPRYIALEDAGALAISASGVEACRAHLEVVACDQQRSDLDGPCAQIWQGRRPVEAPCAPGIESLVCQADSTCVLTTNGCGSCRATVPAGSACGPDVARCESGASCVEGRCVMRGLPGQACDASSPCAIGLSCADGACRGPQIVAVGQPCDQGSRCPYNALCEEGICQAQRAIGESCEASRQCRSGRCEPSAKVCSPRQALEQPCASSDECQSGRCDQGLCAPFLSFCDQPR